MDEAPKLTLLADARKKIQESVKQARQLAGEQADQIARQAPPPRRQQGAAAAKASRVREEYFSDAESGLVRKRQRASLSHQLIEYLSLILP